MSSSTSESSRRRLGHLDALRGIAILLVLMVHAMVVAEIPLTPWQHAFFMSGQRGVELFYIVSAFTLLYSMDLDRRERHSLRNFFVRRFFRIAPLFYLAIIVNVIVNRHTAPTAVQVLSGVVFINGFLPSAINTVAVGGWSVAVETTFYVLLPWLRTILSSTRRALWGVLIATPICFVGSMQLARGGLAEYFTLAWFPYQLPVFLLGILTYRIWQDWCMAESDRNSVRTANLSYALLLLAAALYLGSLNPEFDLVGRVPLRNVHLYSASMLFVPLLLAVSIAPVPFFDNALTRFLGKISYSLYLSHFYVLLAVRRMLGHLTLHRRTSVFVAHGLFRIVEIYVVTLALASGLSLLLWQIIEQPGMRLGRSLIQVWEKPSRRASDRSPDMADTPSAQF